MARFFLRATSCFWRPVSRTSVALACIFVPAAVHDKLPVLRASGRPKCFFIGRAERINGERE